MNAEFRRVKQIFLAAVEKQDATERDAYLRETCGQDVNLRQQVDALLSKHAQAGSFLESPAAGLPSPSESGVGGEGFAATADESSVLEQPGTVIGPYKLLQQIGEGGMGVVWMAEQTQPVHRKVALKVIKPGMDSRQVIARFEAERQALAMMDHVNIARVFDGGTTGVRSQESAVRNQTSDPCLLTPDSCSLTPDPCLLTPGSGRPYFVMELVHGIPITKYCDDNHLTPRERLELFVPVCQAIQHAHQKGIIHRDIKPSNVMVTLYDGKPVPKVIDFGVAKACEPGGLTPRLTERTLFTAFGTMVGTLEYMSPEQAEMSALGVDTRSDIYSLGVLLYELLTGSTPLTHKRMKEAAYAEILRMIKEEEPQKPSTRLSDSGEALASISANRQTEPAKLTKLVKGELDWIVMKTLEKDRNRRYETANGFAQDVQRYLADEPVQACPPSAWYRFRKFARRNKVGLAVAALVLFFLVLLGGGAGWAVRDRAARHAKVAAEVESILVEVDRLEGEQKWPEALAAAQRAEAAASVGEADAATAERVRALLKDLEFIDRLEQIRMQRATSVEGKFDDAGANRDYARAFRDYGVDVEELAVETSIDRLKTHPALAIPLAAALDVWLYARSVASKGDAAGWKRLVTIARGIDPDLLRDRLRSAWGRRASEVSEELRRIADSIDVRAQHPVTLAALARTLMRAKHSDFARRLLRDAQYVYPGDFWLNFDLGNVLSESNDHEGAIRFYTAVVSIRPQATAALNNLGNELGKQKKLDEAIAAYHRAIELDPKYPHAYTNLGIALGAQKKLGEAIAAYGKAIELDPRAAAAYSNLGALLCDDLKEYDKAIKCFRKAIELDPNSANAHSNLGSALYNQWQTGGAAQARQTLDEAIAAKRKALALDPKHTHARRGLGVALGNKGWDLVNRSDPKARDPKRALETVQEAIELGSQSAVAWQHLGWVRYRLGDWPASIEALDKSCQLENGGDSAQWIVLALAHARLAARAGLPEKEREQRKTEARRWYDQAVKQIDAWPARPGDVTGQAIWNFRAEARELMGPKDSKK